MAFSQVKTLILRAEIDNGSNLRLLLGDVHAAACGLKIEGPSGPSMHPREYLMQRFFMIVDIHTHVFPDRIAAAAVDKLQAASHTKAFLDGTAAALRASMQAAGIDCSVVLPVATNARQVMKVNDASLAMNAQAAETGILSFGCMHPDFEDADAELTRLARAGIRGIKLHPLYQGADIDDPRFLRILSKAGELGLIVLMHAGYDVGIPGVDHASPRVILRAVRSVGPVKMILAHMGGWRCWEEAEDLLAGLGLYIDTSFSLGNMTPNGDGYYQTEEDLRRLDETQFLRLIRAFGPDHVLFGTDSPWEDQTAEVRRIQALPLSDAEKQAILVGNAGRLLSL